MKKIQITVADEHTKNMVIRLLHSIDGVQVKESHRGHASTPEVSLRSLAGIWKNHDISFDEIRQKAWKRPA